MSLEKHFLQSEEILRGEGLGSVLLSAGESAFTDACISGRNTHPRIPAGGDWPCLLPMSAEPTPTLSEKKIWTLIQRQSCDFQSLRAFFSNARFMWLLWCCSHSICHQVHLSFCRGPTRMFSGHCWVDAASLASSCCPVCCAFVFTHVRWQTLSFTLWVVET